MLDFLLCSLAELLEIAWEISHEKPDNFNWDCQFSAKSTEIRCAVNPRGPCSGCSHFEATPNPPKFKLPDLSEKTKLGVNLVFLGTLAFGLVASVITHR